MAKVKMKRQAEFIKWMNPILVALNQLGGSATSAVVIEQVARNEKVSDDTLAKMSKTGVPIFKNQVAWARQYLVWEELLDSSKRGRWSLTEKGYSTTLSLEQSRAIFLKWVEFFAQARRNKNQSEAEEEIIEEQEASEPDKVDIRLIDVLQNLSPEGFEQVCKILLTKNGFEDVQVTQRSRDGGIDGIGTLIINPFVKLRVAFQCKKYASDNPVRFEQISQFRGVTNGKFDKAIMITTSKFTSDAIKAANEVHFSIEIVDGDRLVELFEKVKLGVVEKTVLEVDLNFFQPFTNK